MKKLRKPVPVSIKQDEQQLPAAIDSFWASELKIIEALQMRYIQWVSTKYNGEKPIHFGRMLKIVRVHLSTVPSL